MVTVCHFGVLVFRVRQKLIDKLFNELIGLIQVGSMEFSGVLFIRVELLML